MSGGKGAHQIKEDPSRGRVFREGRTDRRERQRREEQEGEKEEREKEPVTEKCGLLDSPGRLLRQDSHLGRL
jgi:hypothetical protein